MRYRAQIVKGGASFPVEARSGEEAARVAVIRHLGWEPLENGRTEHLECWPNEVSVRIEMTEPDRWGETGYADFCFDVTLKLKEQD